jgi:hypothetical protein
MLRDRGRDGGGILRGDERDTTEQRRKRRAIMLVPGHRQRTNRSAVERMLKRDDLGPLAARRPPESARKLQARLHRLRAAVAEKRPRHPRQIGQPRGQLSLKRVMEQIRRVHQRGGLFGNGPREHRMRVPERRDADPGDQIEVTIAVPCEQRAPATGCEYHRRPAIHLQHVLLIRRDRVYRSRRHRVISKSGDRVIVVPGK